MRGTGHPKNARRVRRRFEPDRLSPTRIADAYEKIVPRNIHVFGISKKAAKFEQVHKQPVIGGWHGTGPSSDLCPSFE